MRPMHSSDDHRVRLGLIQHLQIIGEESHAFGNFLFGAIDQCRIRFSDGDEIGARFALYVFQHAPDVVVVEPDDPETNLGCVLLRWRIIRK